MQFEKQECIPVGCVPAARRPYAGVCFPGGGGCLVRGVSAAGGGVCSGGSAPGGCLVSGRGVSAPGGVCSGGCMLWGGLVLGGVCLSWGGSLLPGEGCLLQGVCSWGVSGPGGCLLVGGVGIPACTEADPPLWTEWQTGVKILPWPQLRGGR